MAANKSRVTWVISAVLGLLLSQASMGYADGVAVCLQRPSSNEYSINTGNYWSHTGGPGASGYEVNEELRRALRQEGIYYTCSSRDGKGYWAVVDNGRSGSDLRLGIGFGSTQDRAVRDAEESVWARTANWSRLRDRYRLLNVGNF